MGYSPWGCKERLSDQETIEFVTILLLFCMVFFFPQEECGSCILNKTMEPVPLYWKVMS